MGGSQTYEVSWDSLVKSIIGKGTNSNVSKYFFIDQKFGFYSIKQEKYDEIIKMTDNSQDKLINMELEIICPYDYIILASFNDHGNDVWINFIVRNSI